MATGTWGWRCWMYCTSSMPVPSGRRMSVRHRSMRSRVRQSRASLRLRALRVSSFMRPRVISSSSRISGSSSTIRAFWRLMKGSCSCCCSGWCWRPAHLAGMGEGDAETAAPLGARVVGQVRLVALAQLAGDVQAQAGALAVGGVERLEDVLLLVGLYAGPVVEHIQHRQVALRIPVQAHPHLAVRVAAGAVAQAVLHQIAEDLGQLVRVEAGLDAAAGGLQVQLLVAGGVLAELAGEAVQPVLEVEQLGHGLAAPRQLQHVLDHV